MLIVSDSVCVSFCFFFKQKTAYEMRISDWSSDVCSSDLRLAVWRAAVAELPAVAAGSEQMRTSRTATARDGLLRELRDASGGVRSEASDADHRDGGHRAAGQRVLRLEHYCRRRIQQEFFRTHENRRAAGRARVCQ